MTNLITSQNWGFDITKAQLKVIGLFSEVNKQYSLITEILCNKNNNKAGELNANEYLSNIIEQVNAIQIEIEQLKENLIIIKEFL
jgi:flagellar basal body P-ring protein FlgI